MRSVIKKALASVLISTAVATLGCAGVRRPLTCPAQGGATWAEFTSRHFVLMTDAEVEDARDHAVRFEHSYDLLADLVFHRGHQVPGRVRVILFEREKDYRQFGSSVLDGYYNPSMPHDVEPIPTIVLFGEITERTRRSFQHQLTHHFARMTFGELPPWLDEGLAVYYSTARTFDGNVSMGKQRDLIEPGPPQASRSSNDPVRGVLSYLPSVAELFAADRTMFYANTETSWDTSDEERRRQEVYYLGAFRARAHADQQPPRTIPLVSSTSVILSRRGSPSHRHG